MSDEYTTYSENDKKNIESWLNTNGINQSCQLCNDGEYELRDGIVTPQYMDFKSGLLSDEGIPMIRFECENCSNVRLFALYKILPYKVK